MTSPSQCCISCHLVKNLSEFHLDSKGKFGRQSVCKECRASQAKQYRVENLDKVRKYKRDFYRKNKIKYAKNTRDSYLKRREKILARGKSLSKDKRKERRDRHEAKYPKRIKAKRDLNNAVRDGKMKKPLHCIINNERCRGQVEGHHVDYNKPFEVLWFCVAHHNTWHRIFIPID